MFDIKTHSTEIVELIFDTDIEMAKTMLRFQGHYESPKFKGKFFTLKEFKDWYTKKKGKFTYYTDWAGFSVTGKTFIPFMDGEFGYLSNREKDVLNFLESWLNGRAFLGIPRSDFYVIATSKESPSGIEHELHHALFYLNKPYREKVYSEIEKYDLSSVYKFLSKIEGYHNDVFIDEVNAYLCCDSDILDENKTEYPLKLKKKLISLYEKWS